MTSGRVKTIHERTGHRVFVVGTMGQPQWSEVWDNNPRVARNWTGDEIKLVDCPQSRPYIARKDTGRYFWQRFDLRPGELHLTEAEKRFARRFAGRVFVEPNTKVKLGNKAWLPTRWQQVVDAMGCEFIQCGPGPYRLKGAQQIPHTTFRQAAAILAVSRAYVGTEGAMNHVAAAFGVPAVVLWSEFVSPQITGYATQRNIRHAGEPCGSRAPCQSCKESMAAISVDEVLENLRIALC